MKKLFLLLTSLLAMHNAKADYLLRVDFANNLWVGHWVIMYYAANDLNQLYNKLHSIDTINERKILAAIGLPLDKDNDSQENCVVPKSVKFNYDKLLSKRPSKKITYKTKEIFFQIKLLSCDYNLCTFPLDSKYWASYDVNFKEAGVLITKPSINSWTKEEKRFLSKLQKMVLQMRSTRGQ
ncbi:hypothetical protein [Polluticoccus soli]|uniref:hypothetical protein n=1 Tax=Polluticoccus soli TaxID=3034150 RepID=UPI0023E14870|nr:hypothetical protein [Flavipsychrobacter sp. JY13-12]